MSKETILLIVLIGLVIVGTTILIISILLGRKIKENKYPLEIFYK